MSNAWRPNDLAIHFHVDGDLDAATTFLSNATGAHDFHEVGEISRAIRFSLAGTPFEVFDKISPELVDDTDEIGAEILDERIPSSSYNMHLRFPFDPKYEDETVAIIKFAKALGSPTALLDGDDKIIYSSSPLDGDYVEEEFIPVGV